MLRTSRRSTVCFGPTLTGWPLERGNCYAPALLPLARDERSDRDYFFTLPGALGEVFGFQAAASNRALATWSGVICPSARARCLAASGSFPAAANCSHMSA